MSVEFNHLEIVLGGAAIRASPRLRHIFPARPCGYSLIGNALGLVVDVAANNAHPFAQKRIFGGADSHGDVSVRVMGHAFSQLTGRSESRSFQTPTGQA